MSAKGIALLQLTSPIACHHAMPGLAFCHLSASCPFWKPFCNTATVLHTLRAIALPRSPDSKTLATRLWPTDMYAHVRQTCDPNSPKESEAVVQRQLPSCSNAKQTQQAMRRNLEAQKLPENLMPSNLCGSHARSHGASNAVHSNDESSPQDEYSAARTDFSGFPSPCRKPPNSAPRTIANNQKNVICAHRECYGDVSSRQDD